MASPSAPTKKQIHQLIRAWEKLGGPDNCTRVRLARSVGMPRQTVNDWIERGAPRYGIPIPVKTEKPIEIIHKEKIETQDKKKQLTELSKKTLQLQEELDIALAIKTNIRTFSIRPIKGVKSEATAVWLASDWHVGERVTLGQTNGINQYSPTIAKQRASDFFINALRLTNIQASSITIKTVVLALLGDFITGHLHMQAVETNYFAPVEETIYAQNLLASGIKYVLENSDYELVIVCKSGNHGRTTKFSEFGSENGHSHEFFMYSSLRDTFKNEKRVKFIIDQGDHTYIDIYKYTCRFLHGHSIKFGGGVGGITIPVNKAMAQWDKVKKAYCTFFGHFHQRMDGGNWMANGSLIGFNAFALSIKASAEIPAQQFCLIDKERGKTIVAPILF